MIPAPTAPRFKRLLWRAILVPFVLMLCIAGVLFWQVHHLLTTAAAVEHSDNVISLSHHLLKLTLDMETGTRGFLLTGEADFLKPYHNARARLEPETQTLTRLLADNPAQLQRIAEIQKLRDQWIASAERAIQTRLSAGQAPPDDKAAIDQARTAKAMMDNIRDRTSELVAAEEQVRDIRSRNSREASQYMLWLVAAIALAGGTLLSLLSRRQFLGLTQTYAMALKQVNDLNATLEQRVEKRTHELREANQELEAFAYSISHDLRAPMRHVAGFADLLRKSIGAQLRPDDAENLEVISQTAQLAGRMVDDLLAFSRVGRTQMQWSDVDVAALVEQCRRDLAPETIGRRIEWRIAPLANARGDGALLRLAIRNLLANAIKYTGKTPQAIIEIGSATDETGSTWFVRDNGIGFAPEFTSKLFGVFQRLHRAEDFEGTGIGLANVRRIILRHGGRVWAQGKPNEGATFFFFLPVAFAENIRGPNDDSYQADSAR